MKDPAFQLSPLGESKVGDRAAVGVKVTHKGHSDVNLYFDKQTGLVRKSEYRAKDAMTGKDREMATTFENYKDFDGLKIPTKIDMKRDGEKFVEAEITELKPGSKLEASVFAKP